jgi:hypothetical protein
MSILSIIYLSAQLLIFEWFEWQENKTIHQSEHALTECNESQNDKTNRKRAPTGRLVRQMAQLTKTFFSKANV